MKNVNIGDTLTCSETGAQFIAARDGCSVNYARNNAGDIFSDAGVDIRERRELSNRKGPFFCYVSSDMRHVTGWKGNKLGEIVSRCIGGGFGGKMLHVRVRDVHGGMWHGKGAGAGMCITLRPMKGG